MIASAAVGSAPLLLRRLAIANLAGLGDGGFALDDLSPGINIIFGPNGVGKSRTAWAINLALWPQALARNPRDRISASFGLAEQDWLVEIDGGSARHQRDGIDTDSAPALADASERDRYNLALGDLLADHGEAFAAAIARESAGGYDLSAAADELGVAKRPLPKWGQQSIALQQAAAAVRECERRVDELREAEARLKELIRDRDAARATQAQAAPLAKALELAQSRQRHHEADAALKSFPSILAKLTGAEADTLRQLRADRQQLVDQSTTISRQRREASTALDQTHLPASLTDADQSVPASLAQASRTLADLSNRILLQKQAIELAHARQERARTALGAGADDHRLAVIDCHKLAELAAAARESELAEVHRRALLEQQQTLADPPAAEPPPDASRLEHGLLLLNSWLSEPETDAAGGASPQRAWIIPTAAALIVLLSLLLAWRVHPALAVFALAGPVLYWFSRRQGAAGSTPIVSSRPALQAQYAALALPTPQWTAHAARAMARNLFEQLGAAQLRRTRLQRRAELEPAIAEARAKCERLMHRRAALATEAGIDVPTDSPSLHAMSEALAAWRVAERDTRAAERAMEPLLQERAELFASVASALSRFGYEINELHELDAATENLRRRLEQHRTSRDRLAALDAQSAEQATRAAEIQRRIDALFAALEMHGEAEEPQLRQLVNQRADYDSARRAALIAAARVAELTATVDPQLAQRPIEHLTAELESAAAAAALERTLSEQIVAVQTQVDAAKRGHELEAAQAARREAAAVLAEARAQHCETAAGWALLEHLQRANRDRHRPAVLRRAAELFARITRGRYRLEFGASNGASANFVAIDSNTGIGQPIAHLSAGTRVQLLLAVRVAFVEQQERGPRLPLLLDEALANSDELRAAQVIDALIEICRIGRQVFYFTAQDDEVQKWRQILQAGGPGEPTVPCKFIDLAQARGWAQARHTPLRPTQNLPRAAAPSPQSVNMDRAAYGKLLHVPGIDPRAELPGGVHLWHLIDDLQFLHRLLERGVSTWGQLETMQQHGGGAGKDAELALQQAAARAKLIGALARLWRIGRGRPLDRTALQEADNAITPTQLPRVQAVAEAVNWDARRLIEQLEDGAVPKFQSRKLEQLRQYLAEEGYIDARPIMGAEALRLAALAAVQGELDRGLLAPAEIDAFAATYFT